MAANARATAAADRGLPDAYLHPVRGTISRSAPIVRHGGARSQGFTLVELLIAIALAIFLIGGVLKIVQDTRRATTFQGQATQLQDNVRLAMTVMSDMIQDRRVLHQPAR